MFKNIKVGSGFIVAAVAFALCACPATAQASWGKKGRGYPHHERYPNGRLTFALPHGSIAIGFGGRNYYYSEGLFYKPGIREYIVVPPPSGAVVYAIPAGYNQVAVDGTTYYVYNGVYYSRVAQGYQVIQPPAPVVLDPSMVSVGAAKVEQQAFTINIPNADGGYSAVIVTRSAKGYVGPQGEFYPEFPKVAQLQVMYGK